jgi:fructose-bisphosphate aldolase class 1
MDEKQVELKIKVDEGMTISLNIPIELDVSTLNGLLQRVKQILSLENFFLSHQEQGMGKDTI